MVGNVFKLPIKNLVMFIWIEKQSYKKIPLPTEKMVKSDFFM